MLSEKETAKVFSKARELCSLVLGKDVSVGWTGLLEALEATVLQLKASPVRNTYQTAMDYWRDVQVKAWHVCGLVLGREFAREENLLEALGEAESKLKEKRDGRCDEPQ